MAELNTSPNVHNTGPGVKKGKKLSTRVDLTPMVDLGFLLITFFIFTTTMTQPRTMKLILPKDVNDRDRQQVGISDVLTIMLGKNDKVYYYERDDPEKLKTANFNGIRDVILDKKRRADPAYFEIILKPSQEATYRNTVDVLDEMAIDAIRHFALVDISQEEYTIMRSKEQ
jgi:biopolymer transport protein ExbD